MKKHIRKLFFKNALKSYKKFRAEEDSKQEKIRKARAHAHLKTITTNTQKHFPNIHSLAITFRKAEQANEPDMSVVLELLKNRLHLLVNLLKEAELTIDNKVTLKSALLKTLKTNPAFLLSTSYLIGQLVSLLNKLNATIDLTQIHTLLAERLADYIALRNHLEHTDPILESCELPYSDMQSKAPEMMAVTVVELVAVARSAILSADAKTLKPINSHKQKQEHALNPAVF